HAERGHHHRDRLFLARARPAHRPGRAGPGLPGDPGGGLRLRGDLRRGEPHRGRALHRAGPAGAALVSRRRDLPALAGLGVIAAAVVVAAFAPALAPSDPVKNRLLDRLTPPMWAQGGSARHPLGTDTLGRDVLSRLLHGARISLTVGLAAGLLAGAVGGAPGRVGR